MELGWKENQNYEGFSAVFTVKTARGEEIANTKPLCIECMSAFLNQNFGMDLVDDA